MDFYLIIYAGSCYIFRGPQNYYDKKTKNKKIITSALYYFLGFSNSYVSVVRLESFLVFSFSLFGPGTFKLISKCIEGKGFLGTKRYFGDLGKSVSDVLFIIYDVCELIYIIGQNYQHYGWLCS